MYKFNSYLTVSILRIHYTVQSVNFTEMFTFYCDSNHETRYLCNVQTYFMVK
jgi:hypothetical protein